MIALGKRPGLLCMGAQPVAVYVGGHLVTPGITLEDYPLQEESGSVVTCEPLTGYKLGITSHITALQEGTGDPSPDNVRPIVGWDSVTLTHNGETHTRALPETVYGGTLDWRTGLLTVTHSAKEFDGTEDWRVYNDGFYAIAALPGCVLATNNQLAETVCSHYIYGGLATGSYMLTTTSGTISPRYINTGYGTVEEWKSYIKSQYAAGTPVEVAYKLATPYTIQLNPQQLVALAGTNTIYSNSGDTTVTYRIRKK